MAEAFDLSGIIGMDAGDFVGGADDAAVASEDVAGSADDMSESLFDVDPAGVAAGAALTGVATAAQGLLDNTQDTRESLGRTAETMGMTSDEAQDLATSMSDATFPLDDVTGTMDSLAQQGIESEDVMQEVALAADDIADATGTTAESVADNAAPALAAMGEEADDLTEHMDTFTFVARETTMDVEDFSQMVRRVGPEIDEMGMSVDDTAAIMAALEDQGMDSRTAMREFRQAANNAEGDQGDLMESLGLSNEELTAQEDALADAEGMTKEHADAANESVSTMDELRASVEDVALQTSGYLEPLSALIPAAQAGGMALMGLSAINLGAVVPAITATMAALTPVLPILLGLAAAGGALYAAWETNFLDIQGVTESVLGALGDGWDWLTGKISDGVDFVIEKVMSIPSAITDIIDRIPGVDSEDILGDVDTDDISEAVFPPKPDEEGEDVGDEMGEATAASSQESVKSAGDFAPDPEEMDIDSGEYGDEIAEEGFDMDDVDDVEPAETDATGAAASGGGGLSAKDIREALEGMALELSGSLPIEGDVATLDDVEAELRRVKRQADNRTGSPN